MTEIADRYTRVAVLDEGPATPLDMAYPEDQYVSVDLSADAMRLAGGEPLQVGRACAIRLEVLYRDTDGVEEGIALSETVSSAVVTCGGTPGTVITAGKRIKIAGSDVLWSLSEAVTIGEGGTADGTFVSSEAEDAGAHDLDTIVDAVSGWSTVDNAAESEEVTAYLPLTLRLYDQHTHRLAHERDAETLLSTTDDRYQIEADTNQDPRSTGEVRGYAGRLVLRWAADDDHPPPVGTWDWELIVGYEPEWGDRGDRVEARGVIEVLA